MIRLTAAQSKQFDALLAALQDCKDRLEQSIDDYNQAAQAAFESVIKAGDEYNNALSEIEGFRDAFVSDSQSEFDEKSERWQQSDRGSAAQDLIDAWECADFSPVELEELEPFELYDAAHLEDLEDLPRKPDC